MFCSIYIKEYEGDQEQNFYSRNTTLEELEKEICFNFRIEMNKKIFIIKSSLIRKNIGEIYVLSLNRKLLKYN